MWRAVVHQAVMDATKPKTDSETALQDYERRTARLWLTTFSLDFIDVCSRGELNPHAVRSRAIGMRDTGWIAPSITPL